MAPATHVLVIGGGIAGAALAIQLSQSGQKVTLVEKTAGPHHKVCGEFLSHEALGYLAGLGIDLVRHGAVPITTVCLAGVAWLFSTNPHSPALLAFLITYIAFFSVSQGSVIWVKLCGLRPIGLLPIVSHEALASWDAARASSMAGTAAR